MRTLMLKMSLTRISRIYIYIHTYIYYIATLNYIQSCVCIVACYLVTRQIIIGLWICELDLFGLLSYGITINHNTPNITISTLR
jgi:hypothetical protein